MGEGLCPSPKAARDSAELHTGHSLSSCDNARAPVFTLANTPTRYPNHPKPALLGTPLQKQPFLGS